MLEAGWRLPVVAGLACGLGLAPFLQVNGGPLRPLLAAVLVVVSIAGRGRSHLPAAITIMLVATLAGLSVGSLRLETIDRAAFEPPTSGERTEVRLSGFVEAEPSRSRGMIRFRLSTGKGRLMVESPDPGAENLPGPGDGILAVGTVGRPPDWYRSIVDRHGLKAILKARYLAPTSDSRTGLTGLIDRMRARAERALHRGMPARETALARGFVLGQDAAIDARTTADFRASGLSHLLAVSGQNVVLLGLLAWPVLALVGAGPQARRFWTVLLILIYVPLAGGGASIQRAGVMGIAILAAATAGRASSRLWALALAVAVTLGLDPRACLDPGWQLSFAAVIGITLFANPLRIRIEGLTGTSGWRRILAEGLAVTLAASAATAPLIAFHFGRLPVGTVAANLVVLPAVAPAMWLGMISAAVGQIWSGLALPFNLLNSVVLAMIAQVAAWFGRPDWAEAGVETGPVGLLVMTAGVLIGGLLLLRLWKPPADDPAGTQRGRKRRRAAMVTAAAGLILVLVFSWSGSNRRSLSDPPAGGVRVEFLDVGQGDAILIRPAGRPPVLIDGGPPGGDLRGALDSAGANHLGATLLTHPDLDHYGGLFDLFPGVETDRLLFDSAPADLIAAARSAGTVPIRVGEGVRLSLGSGVGLTLLWPPPAPPSGSDQDPNARSIGALFSWQDFRMYLPGDGEAEAVPVDPGPIDLLKVAHHGSADSGLPGLLGRDRPRIAVIQVGKDNGYGHPTRETLGELSDAGIRIYRTDRDGTVSLVLDRSGYRIETGH
ncbi:MAG: ComEC/Rec2 family competence protein [Solirubrobacterales bacterium]|nr:ComEC/Rec2 family competence protein [Solirubrobacterales bacterium]